MVKKIEKKVYDCPYCGTEYEDFDDAEECAKECLLKSREDPEEREKVVYQCEGCLGKHKKFAPASRCEKKHAEREDKAYFAMLDRQKRELLERAAGSPGQRKVVEFTEVST